MAVAEPRAGPGRCPKGSLRVLMYVFRCGQIVRKRGGCLSILAKSQSIRRRVASAALIVAKRGSDQPIHVVEDSRGSRVERVGFKWRRGVIV
jgi:hypothetical protein